MTAAVFATIIVVLPSIMMGILVGKEVSVATISAFCAAWIASRWYIDQGALDK